MDLSSLVKSIEELASCPICVEMVRPPVTLCVNGHGTCSECTASTTSCSVCKFNFTTITPRILNDILQVVPKLCKFASLGCKELARNDHEVYCVFREVKCIVGEDRSCTWRGQFKNWKSHVDDTHHGYQTHYEINQATVLSYKDFRKSWRALVICQTVNNNLFILYAFKNKGQLNQTVRLVADKKQDHVYYFKISFWDGDELLFQSRVEATVYDEEEDLENSCNCMTVPINELLKLVMDSGRLEVKFLVTSKQKSQLNRN